MLIVPFLGSSQNKLTIDVLGVKSSDGNISIAVYDTSDSFLKSDQAFKGYSTEAVLGITQLSIEDLPNGTYALAVFHDENGNGELDTNWLGIPKEDVGFSNAKMKTFGPPSFQECEQELNADEVIAITLN